MEIQRIASKKPRACYETVAAESGVVIDWEEGGRRLVLKVDSRQDPYTPTAFYDFNVNLTLADIAKILREVSGRIEALPDLPEMAPESTHS